LLQGNLHLLRSRSRDASRNNAWIRHGNKNWVSNEIGTGIEPRSRCRDEKFRKDANALWKQFAKECDFDGVLDFNGKLWQAVNARRKGGECFIRFRTKYLKSGVKVPLQIQVIDSEQCPIEYTLLTKGIRSGIEFDGGGNRLAYHIHREHPGDVTGKYNDMVRVPASAVAHHYMPLEPGQIRGEPETIASLIKARSFDQYDDSELERKRDRSTRTGVITRPDYGEEDYLFDPISGEPLEREDDGTGTSVVEPGSWTQLLPGEEFTLFEGDNTGSGYADFMRQQLLGIAAGLDVPYENLTGDMKGISDRTLRAVLNEYHRLIEQTQWLFTIPQICVPTWEQFIDHAVMAGLLHAPDYLSKRNDYVAVEWRPDAFPYLHPVQDVQSKLMKIGGGLTSRSAVVAEDQWDADEIDRQQHEDNERAKDLGLQYTHDTLIQPEEDEQDAKESNGTT
jgi:lambda family phage portal protein